MRKILVVVSFILVANAAFAQKNATSGQKVDSIYFHLYTDSLKRGFFNYINVDGKMSDGNWQPLDSTHLIFISDAGDFKGNDLFVDSSFVGDKVRIRAILRSNPKIWKEVVIYIRKRGFDEPLKTNDEIFEDMKKKTKRKG